MIKQLLRHPRYQREQLELVQLLVCRHGELYGFGYSKYRVCMVQLQPEQVARYLEL
jgi:hypothetical protein